MAVINGCIISLKIAPFHLQPIDTYDVALGFFCLDREVRRTLQSGFLYIVSNYGKNNSKK